MALHHAGRSHELAYWVAFTRTREEIASIHLYTVNPAVNEEPKRLRGVFLPTEVGSSFQRGDSEIGDSNSEILSISKHSDNPITSQRTDRSRQQEPSSSHVGLPHAHITGIPVGHLGKFENSMKKTTIFVESVVCTSSSQRDIYSHNTKIPRPVQTISL